MSIVTCPSCQRRYDPDIDEDADDLPGNLSMKVVCPACGQWVRLPELEPVDPPNVPSQVLSGMMKQSRLVDEGDAPRAGRSVPEDRPRRRPPRDAEEDIDDDDFGRPPPRRSYRDQAEDDYGDDFRPRRNPDGMGQAAMVVGIVSIAITVFSVLGSCVCIVGVVGVVVGMIGGVVAIILGFVARSRTPGSGTGLTGILTGLGSLLLGLLIVILAAIGIGFLAMNAPPPGGGPGGGNPNLNKPRRF
jgi:hypothetical protein